MDLAASFASVTIVKRKNDYVKIADIMVGDKVIGYDFETKSLREQKVTAVAINHVDKYLKVNFNDQEVLMSFDQKIFLPSENQWLAAHEIYERLLSKEVLKDMVKIEVINEAADLYKISVNIDNNFFITNSDILAHNFVFIPVCAYVIGEGFVFITGEKILEIALTALVYGVIAYKASKHGVDVHVHRPGINNISSCDQVIKPKYSIGFNNELVATIPKDKLTGFLDEFKLDEYHKLQDNKQKNSIRNIKKEFANVTSIPGPPKKDNDKDKKNKKNKEEKIRIFEKNKKHIFRKAPGHINDTPKNRKLLIKVASSKSNYLGTDKYGNKWFSEILKNKKQVWVSLRGNQIYNGGVNDVPRSFNCETGLCNL